MPSSTAVCALGVVDEPKVLAVPRGSTISTTSTRNALVLRSYCALMGLVVPGWVEHGVGPAAGVESEPLPGVPVKLTAAWKLSVNAEVSVLGARSAAGTMNTGSAGWLT